MEEHREQVHEVTEGYRRPEPREVVEIYRRPPPEEVVEIYTRPMVGRKPEAAASVPVKRKRSKKGLWIFLACAAALVGIACLIRVLMPKTEELPQDPFEKYSGEIAAVRRKEIKIPTVPFGQGGELKLVRQRGETLTAQQIYQNVNPAVVTVMAQQGEGGSVGTGVIFTADGYILTNHHVLEGGEFCRIVLDTGYSYDAFYVAGDPVNDLAVLKVQDVELPAAEFGDSDLLVVGDPVYAIGNPLGVELRGTLTDGIVSAINRDVWVDGRTMTLIQTNAALNSGNSGGPLINEYGQVVGINVIKMTSKYNSVEGLGFAIPSMYLERIINDLLTWGKLQPEPSLGLMVMKVADEPAEGIVGILVDEVTPGSAGDLAGIRVGDYVLAADGQPVASSQDLLRVRRQHYLGEEMTITLWRNGEILDVTLQLNDAVGETSGDP